MSATREKLVHEPEEDVASQQLQHHHECVESVPHEEPNCLRKVEFYRLLESDNVKLLASRWSILDAGKRCCQD